MTDFSKKVNQLNLMQKKVCFMMLIVFTTGEHHDNTNMTKDIIDDMRNAMERWNFNFGVGRKDIKNGQRQAYKTQI